LLSVQQYCLAIDHYYSKTPLFYYFVLNLRSTIVINHHDLPEKDNIQHQHNALLARLYSLRDEISTSTISTSRCLPSTTTANPLEHLRCFSGYRAAGSKDHTAHPRIRRRLPAQNPAAALVAAAGIP